MTVHFNFFYQKNFNYPEQNSPANPKILALASYILSCFNYQIIPWIDASHFENLKELKELRNIVYSSLSTVERKNDFIKIWNTTRKDFKRNLTVKNTLHNFIKFKGILPLDFKRRISVENFLSFFDIDLTDQTGSLSRTVKYLNPILSLSQPPNFARVCLLGSLHAVQIFLKKDPQLAITHFAKSSGASCFELALFTGQLELIRLIWEKGGRPKTVNPFYFVMMYGYKDVLKWMLSECVELDIIQCLSVPDVFSFAHLFFLEDPSIAEILLDRGIDINQKNSHQDTALHIACREGYLNTISLLLERNADISIKNKNNETPLEIAFQLYNRNVLILLGTKRKADLLKNDCYLDCLYEFCLNGDLELFTLFFEDSNNHSESKRKHESLLIHTACIGGCIGIVTLLKEANFNLKAELVHEEETLIPLHRACRHGHEEVVQYFINQGQDINIVLNENKKTPLFYAIDSGRLSLVLKLLKNGAEIDHRDEKGLTPLIYTLKFHWKKEEIALALMEHHADISLKDNENQDALQLALFNHSHAVVKKILQDRKTPFSQIELNALMRYEAERENFFQAVEWVKQGADPNFIFVRDENTATLLKLLFTSNLPEEKKIQIMNSLLPYKLDLNLKNNRGFIPLHYAVTLNSVGLTQYLLNNGADLIHDTQGLCFTRAVDSGNKQLIDLLIQHNAPVNPNFSENHPLVISLHWNEEMTLRFIRSTKTLSQELIKNIFFEACLFGKIKTIELLLQKGFDLNQEPLTIHFALLDFRQIGYLNPELALFDEADFDLTDFEQNKYEVVKLLLQNKAVIMPSILINAYEFGIPLKTIDLLIQHGADLNVLNEHKDDVYCSIFRNGSFEHYQHLSSLNIKPDFKSYPFAFLSRAHSSQNERLILSLLKEIDPFSFAEKELTSFIPTKKLESVYASFDQGFFKILKTLKKLAYSFSLEHTTTLMKKNLDLIGFITASGLPFNTWLTESLSCTFKNFLKTNFSGLRHHFSENVLKNMCESLSSFEEMKNGLELEKQIMQKKAVILSSGFEGHTLGLVFFKHPVSQKIHLIMANRGHGTSSIGLSEIPFNPKNLAKGLNQLNEIFLFSKVKRKTMEDTWDVLSSVGIMKENEIPLIEQFPQQEKSCAFDNIKASFAGLLYAYAILEGKKKKDSILLAHELYKSFTAFERNECLEEALEVFNPDIYPEQFEFDFKFFEKLYHKIDGDPRIERKYPKKLKKIIKEFDFMSKEL